jgi:hypothetical protein
MSNKEDVIKTHGALGREARLDSVVSFAKALSVLAAAGVLVGGCYGHYSQPTGAYPATYRYHTSYVAYPRAYHQPRYDYNRWPHYGYPYGGYGTQGVRY